MWTSKEQFPDMLIPRSGTFSDGLIMSRLGLKYTLVLTEDNDELNEMAPNDTAYKRLSCHSGYKLLFKLCRKLPPPTLGAIFSRMAGVASHKSG